MTSVLAYVRQCYHMQMEQPIPSNMVFKLDCLERIGKQMISILVSSGLIRSEENPTNRDISLALKTLEPLLINKLKLKDKRQLYRVFGLYCYQQLPLLKDEALLELQLMQTFFKIMDSSKASKSQASTSYSYSTKSSSSCYDSSTINSYTSASSSSNSSSMKYSKNDQYDDARTMYTSKSSSSTARSEQVYKKKNIYSGPIEQQKRKYFQLDSIEETSQKLQSLEFSPEKDKLKQPKAIKTSSNNLEDSFEFQQTLEDIQKRNRQICQNYFIDIVAYLEKLSSPQGELTYIWQHLKYQGFQTQYEPFMNEANQWTCTATIRFPPGMYKDSFLQRTQCSKNKKKARQLACMDLLKSLYLSYPEVWMLYKHLKQEKRLVISSLDGPKDEDEIQLIRSRKGIVMDNDKIEKLFRHNKKDIRKLMEKISAKAELNTLLQQLPGRVTSPKLEKKMVEGNWSVPVKIEYKTYEDIQNNRLPKIYEKTIVFYNTKIAEEQAYMEAIIEMYQDNPELFQKIQSIKLAKNIKDPQKKLPLLRNAKEVK